MNRAVAAVALGLAAYALTVAAVGLTARARPADMAIVFGNTVAPDSTPSPRRVARLETAAQLYRSQVVPAIFVSGARGVEGVNEAPAMRAWLVRHGVPVEAIIVDPAGYNTWSTCMHARAVLEDRGGHRVVLVTQWFHIARAELAARAAGLHGVSAQAPRWAEPRDLYAFARELAAVPFYAQRAASTHPAAGR